MEIVFPNKIYENIARYKNWSVPNKGEKKSVYPGGFRFLINCQLNHFADDETDDPCSHNSDS